MPRRSRRNTHTELSFSLLVSVLFRSFGTSTRYCSSGHCKRGEYRKVSYSCVSGYVCSLCPPGKFSKTEYRCDACPAGRSNSGHGQIRCARCVQGWYQDVQGSATCTKCASCQAGSHMIACGGVYGPGVCKSCPKGYFSFSGASLCIDTCPSPFSYHNLSGTQACASCPKGQFTSHAGNPYCVMGSPPAALIPRKKAHKATTCAAGTIARRNKYGVLLTCVACPVGKFAVEENVKSCVQCRAGFYSNVRQQSACAACKRGFYSIKEGQIACILCPSSKFASQLHSTSCISCAAGRYQFQYGASSCVKCPSGQHSSDRLTRCVKDVTTPKGPTYCGKGKFMHSETGHCVLCDPGLFQDAGDKLSCNLCPRGKFNTHRGRDCERCPPGKFQSSPGQTSCRHFYNEHRVVASGINVHRTPTTSSPSRTHLKSLKNQPDKSKLKNHHFGEVKCQKGQYYASRGRFTACKSCPAGKYQPYFQNGLLLCYPCPAGKYTTKVGLASCLVCGRGHYHSSTGGANCTRCDIGFFSQKPGTAYCDRCPAGKYQLRKAQSSCPDCGPGKFQSASASASCNDCTAGFYQADTAQRKCHRCDPWELPDPARSRCVKRCPPGSFQFGDIGCSHCLVGQFQPMSGSSTCISCPAGKTSSQLDNFQECHLCPGGRYLVARTSHCVPCKSCAAGKFRVGCGSDESSQDGRCISCGIGLFKDIAGEWNTTCRVCSKYQYSNSIGAKLCKSCPIGSIPESKRNRWTGSATSCVMCSVGWYQPQLSQACTRCPPGKYQRLKGQARCTAKTGAPSLAPTQLSKNRCNPHSTGDCNVCQACCKRYVPNGVDCDECVAAQCASSKQRKPSLCSKGSHPVVHFSGEITCKLDALSTKLQRDCPSGKHRLIHLVSGLACLPASAAVPSGSQRNSATTSGAFCERGSYLAQDGNLGPLCKACPIGKFQPNRKQTFCHKCFPGTYANEMGLLVCHDCPGSKFQDEAGATYCKFCPGGKFELKVGSVGCNFEKHTWHVVTDDHP